MTVYRELSRNRLPLIVGLSLSIGIMIIFFTGHMGSSSYYYFKYALFFSLSVFIIRIIQSGHFYYLPSFYLFSFFAIIPIFGIAGYLFSYKKIFPNYLGVDLDMWRALDMWLQGLFFVMLGVLIPHLYRRYFRRKRTEEKALYSTWNWKSFNVMLLILFGISLAFSIFVASKLGNIPILIGDIDQVRFSFSDQVGAAVFKLSRLWALLYMLVVIKLVRKIGIEKGFSIGRNIHLLGLLILCLFFEGMYGDRFHQFILVAFSVLIINKYIGKIKLKYMLAGLFIGIFAANIIYIARNKSFRDLETGLPQKMLLHTFGEFNVFAYTVQEYHYKNEYLGVEAFVPAVADLIPEKVWALFNIDKQELRRDKSPAAALSRIYKHYYGMRAGIIGDGYIAFGYLGIIFVSMIAGILFGVLENIFITLRAFDVKELVVTFAISILMFLPLSQTDALTGTFAYYIYSILALIIFFRKKELDETGSEASDP